MRDLPLMQPTREADKSLPYRGPSPEVLGDPVPTVAAGHTMRAIVQEAYGTVPDEILRLAEIARTLGKSAYLIDGVKEINPDWFEGVETVLITAGASAPEDVVEECVQYLQNRFGATLESRTIREEHVSFPLPRELRPLPMR